MIQVALDAEESGLQGARALVRDSPVPLARMGVNLNLDMLARGSGTLWAAGAFHTPVLEPVLDAVATTLLVLETLDAALPLVPHRSRGTP